MLDLSWGLSDSKSIQVSNTHSILADLNNAVVWMDSTHPPISSFSSPLTKPFGTVPMSPSIIGIIFTLIFTVWSTGTPKSTVRHVPFFLFCFLFFFFFLFIITRSGLLTGIMWSICISKSLRMLCVSFFRIDSGLCIYHLVAWLNVNFLCNFLSITFPTQSCLVLYFFVLVCCIRLCDWLFRPYHPITYTCCSVIYFHFNIVGSFGVILCCYLKRFSFILKVSLS